MQEQNLGKVNIIVAVYGLKTVTEQIVNLIIDGNPQTLDFKVNNQLIGDDGWRGQQKSLMIVYNYDGGDLQVAAPKEDDILSINPDKFKIPKFTSKESYANSDKLSVLAASYGPEDVTYKVRNLVSSYNTLSFSVDNTVFGDSWYGVAKILVIVLGSGREVKGVEVFAERENCYIDLNDAVPAL